MEIDTAEDVGTFKAKLFSLTGVPVDRQKVMGFKGGNLKDGAEWSSLGLKNGKKIMLIGSAEELPPPPEKEVVFVEDMSVEDQARLAMVAPPGLENLGNTCYLNSTLQVFRVVPELAAALEKYNMESASSGGMESHLVLTGALKSLWEEISASTEKIVPLSFVMVFRQLLPQFAERGQNGGFKQQDAEECWTTLMSMMVTQLPGELMNKMFMGEMTETMRCLEAPEEEPTVRSSSFAKLTCPVNAEVNFLLQGLESSLSEEIEKNSSSLGRSALYLKQSAISRLPGYLTVSMGRFFWKANEGIKAKILRSVKFSMELDVMDLCSSELQAHLRANRAVIDSIREEADAAVISGQALKDKDNEDDSEATPMDVAGSSSGATDQEPEETPSYIPFDIDALPEDQDINKTGLYELCGVVTHQGRSAEAGHYVGWVCDRSGQWLKFNDDVVTLVSEDDILKLSGGGDWHVAYILLYRSKHHPELAVPPSN